jgi:hypothetical protein
MKMPQELEAFFDVADLLEAGLVFLLPALVAALLFWSSEIESLGRPSKSCFMLVEGVSYGDCAVIFGVVWNMESDVIAGFSSALFSIRGDLGKAEYCLKL